MISLILSAMLWMVLICASDCEDNCPNSLVSVGAQRMTAVDGSRDRNTLVSFPSCMGPTTMRSWAGASWSCHESLLRTVTPGAWRSVCQQAVSNRANSVSSVRITTLACRNEGQLLKFPSGSAGSLRYPLQFLCFAERRGQTFRADSKIHCRFRVFCLLGHVHALLQSRHFHACHV